MKSILPFIEDIRRVCKKRGYGKLNTQKLIEFILNEHYAREDMWVGGLNPADYNGTVFKGSLVKERITTIL